MSGSVWRWAISSNVWHWIWNIAILVALLSTLVTIGGGVTVWLGGSAPIMSFLIATITAWVVVYVSFIGALLTTGMESTSRRAVGSGTPSSGYAGADGGGFGGGGGGCDGGGC